MSHYGVVHRLLSFGSRASSFEWMEQQPWQMIYAVSSDESLHTNWRMRPFALKGKYSLADILEDPLFGAFSLAGDWQSSVNALERGEHRKATRARAGFIRRAANLAETAG